MKSVQLLKLFFLLFLPLFTTQIFPQEGFSSQKGIARMDSHPEETVPKVDPCQILAMSPENVNKDGRCFYSMPYGHNGFISCITDNQEFKNFVYNVIMKTKCHNLSLLPGYKEELQKYFPILIEGLNSENVCVVMEAIHLLGESGDERAIEPLLQILEKYPITTQEGCFTYTTLVEHFDPTYVVHYVIDNLTWLRNNVDKWEDLCGHNIDSFRKLPPDIRFFNFLTSYYENPKRKTNGEIVLDIIAEQARRGNFKKELTAFVKRDLEKIKNSGDLSIGVLRILASEDNFDLIADFYYQFCLCEKSSPNCRTLFNILKGIGGEKFIYFCKVVSKNEPSPDKKEAVNILFDHSVEQFFSSNLPHSEFIDWLKKNCNHDLLKNVDSANFYKAKKKLMDNSPYLSNREKIEFLQKASDLFKENKKTYASLQFDLYRIYSSNDVNDLESALQCLKNGIEASAPSQYSYWIDEKIKIEEKIKNCSMEREIEVTAIKPSGDNLTKAVWKGEITSSKETIDRLNKTALSAYLEFFDSEDKLCLMVPCDSEWVECKNGVNTKKCFEIKPYRINYKDKKPKKVRGKLLFISQGEGFRGSVESQDLKIQ